MTSDLHQRPPAGPPASPARPDPEWVWIPVDTATATHIRFATNLHGYTESMVIVTAIRRLAVATPEAPRRDQWTPIPVRGDYNGVVVEGEFIAGTQRLVVRSGPLAGKRFASPSGAASAVVAALNPDREGSPQTNGWRFWRDAETGERLEVYRRK